MIARPPRLRIRAPAKINLTLRVLGTRADGYHDLRTTFQSLLLHDTLTFTAAPGPFRIVCDAPSCPTDEQNLVWRAADALWRAADRRGCPADVRVDIAKRIPLQAGLGGGSSDAAAALRALTVFWRMKLDEAALRMIARGLGADVPFFFDGGTVLGLDRGDNLFPLIDRASAWVVLAVPDFGVSTRDAYEWWDHDRLNAAPQAGIGNDLQDPVSRRHPMIGRLVRRLRRLGATHAAMSGSGSAVFGLFERDRVAVSAARALSSGHLTTIVTKTLGRGRYPGFTRPR